VKRIVGMDVKTLRDWEGKELPPALRAELLREQERLETVNQQMKAIRIQRHSDLKEPETAAEKKAAKLNKLMGIGEGSADLLSKELFGWRTFSNRRQVGSIAGLTGTPYSSGSKNVDQGISKAGNKRVRQAMIEVSWQWLRFQPNSDLAKWFSRRFDLGSKRMKRIGIVALARRLLIALWRYAEFDEIPAGAIVRS
jgi:transposase